MQEIVPGIYHWSAFHTGIGQMVSSYYIAPAGIVIDPMLPEQGLEALPGRPEQVVLTIGLHDRHAQAFADAFSIPIRTSAPGAKRVRGQLEVEPYVDGEELAPGVTAIEIDAIAPDEYALYIDVGEGAMSFADGVINYGGLGFVPDALMGDDPQAIKRGLRQAFARLLSRDFTHLLFAHGDPLVGGGKEALRSFVEAEA